MEKKDFRIGEFISIYTTESDRFGLGQIIALDEKNIIISSVDPLGLESGLILYKIEAVIKIEKNDQYSQKIQKLMKLKKTDLFKRDFKSNNLIFELLEIAEKSKKIVSIQLNYSGRSDVVGIVSSLKEDICEIQQIDLLGKADGFCMFSLGDITSIKYDDSEDRDLGLLF